MKQKLRLYNLGDLIKIDKELYLVISHDKINHNHEMRIPFVVWWTLLLDMKGNFFEIDSELLSKCADLVSRRKNE